MKNLIFLLISLLFLSCSDEQITKPGLSPIEEATIGVKTKTTYPSLESSQVLSIEDFEYNTGGQLQKIIYYGGNREILNHYELFNYDRDGKLNYKLDYYNSISSPTGIILDSTSYSYNGNMLVSEKTTYPMAHYFDEYKYDYNGKYLIKKSIFHNYDLESYSTYIYEYGKMKRETIFNKDDSVIRSKI